MPPDGEARGVRLALDELLAAELGDGAAVGGRRQERVVLLGGDAGHRLEPVGVVRGAVFDGPVLERARDDVGNRRVDRLALRDRAPEGAIHVLGQPGALRLVVECQRAELLAGLAAVVLNRPQVSVGGGGGGVGRRVPGPRDLSFSFGLNYPASAGELPPGAGGLLIDAGSSGEAPQMRGRFEGNDYLPRRLRLQILLADGGARSAVSGVKSGVYGGPAYVYNVSYMKPFPFGAILGEFEQLVLLALLRLGNGAFGAAIHREIVTRTGRDLPASAVYVTLDRLDAKRMVCPYVGTPTAQRGGRRRKHYLLDTAGQRALARAYRTFGMMTAGLQDELEDLASGCGPAPLPARRRGTPAGKPPASSAQEKS